MCTSIVEARGLEVIGIYRVPGNTASISQLTESVNKGFENINLQVIFFQPSLGCHFFFSEYIEIE